MTYSSGNTFWLCLPFYWSFVIDLLRSEVRSTILIKWWPYTHFSKYVSLLSQDQSTKGGLLCSVVDDYLHGRVSSDLWQNGLEYKGLSIMVLPRATAGHESCKKQVKLLFSRAYTLVLPKTYAKRKSAHSSHGTHANTLENLSKVRSVLQFRQAST